MKDAPKPNAQAPRPRTDAERRLRQADRLARILRLIQLVAQQQVRTASELAAAQECSTRTVYRDLEVLELAALPIRYDRQERRLKLGSHVRLPPLPPSRSRLLEPSSPGEAVAREGAPATGASPERKPSTRPQRRTAYARQQLLRLRLARLLKVSLIGWYRAEGSRGRRHRRVHFWPLGFWRGARRRYLIVRSESDSAPQLWPLTRLRSLYFPHHDQLRRARSAGARSKSGKAKIL